MEQLPRAEVLLRLQRLKKIWQKEDFKAEGIFIFSRVHIYYFTGTLVNGVLFIPLEGEPILMVRKGLNRALKEAAIFNIVPFRSYSQILAILADFNYKPQIVGVEKRVLSWELAELFQSKVKVAGLLEADNLIAKTRAVKSDYELSKLKIAGKKHHEGLFSLLPLKIKPGLSEYEIAKKVWEIFFELGHAGLMRMQAFGEEIFLGHISSGDSGNYASAFNGPLGLRGVHPLVPQMGFSGKLWQKNEPLSIDVGFCWQGYHTDKTQIYFPKEWKRPKEVDIAQNFCEEVQEMAREHLKPGVSPEEIYQKALNMAKKQGLEEGFMGLKDNKVPFLGHGIGLFIDEYPALANKFKEPLAENMVIALEPKYGLKGIGMVGVENTFVVTKERGKCLTGDIYSPILI